MLSGIMNDFGAQIRGRPCSQARCEKNDERADDDY
jgi:hypothetical protein